VTSGCGPPNNRARRGCAPSAPHGSDKVANLPQPVIAAVQGHCSTGAMELALAADILANSWHSNQVDKRALLESDGLTLHAAHALNLFKNEGLAPDAAQRVAKFFKGRKP